MAFGARRVYPNDTRPRVAIGVNLPFSEPGVFTPNFQTDICRAPAGALQISFLMRLILKILTLLKKICRIRLIKILTMLKF